MSRFAGGPKAVLIKSKLPKTKPCNYRQNMIFFTQELFLKNQTKRGFYDEQSRTKEYGQIPN